VAKACGRALLTSLDRSRDGSIQLEPQEHKLLQQDTTDRVTVQRRSAAHCGIPGVGPLSRSGRSPAHNAEADEAMLR